MRRKYGLLVAINWKQILPKHKTRLFKGLYGSTCFSNYGRYIYPTEGVLSSIPHIKIARSVFIIQEGKEEKIKALFSGTGAELYIRRVVLSEEDGEIYRRRRRR